MKFLLAIAAPLVLLAGPIIAAEVVPILKACPVGLYLGASILAIMSMCVAFEPN